MDQDNLPTLPIPQLRDQPIVEPATFKDRHELAIHFSELFKEQFDFLWACADLATKYRVAIFIANRDCDLLAVLVDCEIQHFFVLRKDGWPANEAVPYFQYQENALSDSLPLS